MIKFFAGKYFFWGVVFAIYRAIRFPNICEQKWVVQHVISLSILCLGRQKHAQSAPPVEGRLAALVPLLPHPTKCASP